MKKRLIDDLSDEQIKALFGKLFGGDIDAADHPPLAKALYRDETTLGEWPNWPGSKDYKVWKPQVAPTPQQRVLLLRACWRLLTGQELPEMPPLKTAEIIVRFDFCAGYDWPSVELNGRKP
jgi:hypothetical protein